MHCKNLCSISRDKIETLKKDFDTLAKEGFTVWTKLDSIGNDRFPSMMTLQTMCAS